MMANGKRFRRIILHIGLGKTGSTTIQRALLTAADRLESEFGMHYPRVFDDPRPFEGNHTLFLRSLFIANPETKRPNIVAGLGTAEAIAAANASLLEHFQRGFDACDADTLLLSAEGAGHFDLETFQRLGAWLDTLGDEVRVIACLRHPRHALPSEIQQRLKTGRILERMYQSPPYYKFRKLFSDVEAVFGKRAMVPYDFADARRHEGGVVGCFLEQIGLGDIDGIELDELHNPRLSHEATLVLDALNRARPLVKDGVVNTQRHRGDLYSIVQIPGRAYRPPAHVYAELDQRVAPQLEWLEAHYQLRLDAMGAGPDPEAPADLAFSPESVEDLALKVSDLTNLRAVRRRERQARKPLVLHVGLGKTGTTVLQEFFWNNRERLAELGVLYPARGAVDHAHHLLSPHVPQYMKERWNFVEVEDWARALGAAGRGTLLLSSEIMSSAVVAEITPYFEVLKRYFEPRVVFYLRRQDHLISSHYNQMVKSGRQIRPIQKILARQITRMDFEQRLAPWVQAVGQESMVVRPYEPRQFVGGDIRSDFLQHALGMELDDSFELSAANPNPRFPVDVLEYKRLLNWFVVDRPMHRRCNVLLQAYAESGGDTGADTIPESFLSPAERLQVLDAVAESNASIARRFLGREDGQLFLEPAPTADESWLELRLSEQQACDISLFLLEQDAELAQDIRALAVAHLEEASGTDREAAEQVLHYLSEAASII